MLFSGESPVSAACPSNVSYYEVRSVFVFYFDAPSRYPVVRLVAVAVLGALRFIGGKFTAPRIVNIEFIVVSVFRQQVNVGVV
jgi:hypothetical protein